jgi:hypothetical protein
MNDMTVSSLFYTLFMSAFCFLIGMVIGAFAFTPPTSPQQRQQQAWENYLEARDE